MMEIPLKKVMDGWIKAGVSVVQGWFEKEAPKHHQNQLQTMTGLRGGHDIAGTSDLTGNINECIH